MRRPSTRCSRSAALPRRNVERRRTTSKRWPRKTSSISLEAQRARLAVDQRDRVDAEGVLERGLAVELLEDRLGDEAVLDLDDQAQALVAVAELLDVGDALELLGEHELLDLLDDALLADAVGQLGDHDALAARGDRLDAGGRAHPERAAAGLVGVADAVEPDDLAAGRQVGAGDEAHQVVERRLRVGDQVLERLDHLDEVVRGDVGGHADRDARRAVDQQVGDRGRQDDRLRLAGVVVGLEVDGVLVDRRRHRDRGRRHPALGVAHRGGRVVGRAEVAVAVDGGQPHRPATAPSAPARRRSRRRRAGAAGPSPRRRRGRSSRARGRAAATCRPSCRGCGAAPA